MIVNTEYADISLSSSRCEPWSLRPRPKVNIPASGARGHRFPMCGEFPAILPISPSHEQPGSYQLAPWVSTGLNALVLPGLLLDGRHNEAAIRKLASRQER